MEDREPDRFLEKKLTWYRGACAPLYSPDDESYNEACGLSQSYACLVVVLVLKTK